MEYIVGSIPGEVRINPEAGERREGRRRKRAPRASEAGKDSIEISAEARSRVANVLEGAGGEGVDEY